jgi:KDO2-lipid IV(A) lauroyltransferase
MDANYDPPKNPLFAAFLLDRRKKYVKNMIGNRSMRQMVRSLRSGGCVWYSPDQHVGQNDGGVMTRFFGREVLTVNGVSRMAKMTGAVVIPFLPVRNEGNRGYHLKVFPPLRDFPGPCSIEDTQRINDLLEAHIREYPAQYFWLHKRFKPTNINSHNWYL